jgi:hypothetical protein
VPIAFKSGSPNLLEHYGPVQACNGIALPLPLPLPRSPQGGRHGWVYNMHGGEDKRIQSLVGSPAMKRTLGRPDHRYENHVKTDLQQKKVRMALIGFNWLRIDESGSLL